MKNYQKALELYKNEDKEINVINCIYQYASISEKMITKAIEGGIEPKHFHSLELGSLFENAVDRTLDNKTLSLIDLPDKYISFDLLDQSSYESDIRDLIELYQKRQVLNNVYKACELLGSGEVEEAKATVGDIFNQEENREKTIQDIDISKIFGNQDSQRGIPSLIKPLDDRKFQFLPGHLYAVGADTGAGKTTLALNMLARQISAGKNVLIFSIEQPMEEIYLRLLTILSGFSEYQIKAGTADQSRVYETDSLIKQHCEIIDTNIITTQIMEMKAKIINKKKPLSLIVVDLWQLIQNNGSSQIERLVSSADGLLALAKNLSIPVIVIAQVDKVSSRMSQLDRNAFSGSKQLSNNSSYVFMLQKGVDEGGRDQTQLEIVKSRKPGHAGTIIPIPIDNRTEAIMI